jgi:hypothetical protein
MVEEMKNRDDLGTNKIIQEYRGRKVEMSLPVIGIDVHEFMEMVVGFMLATGWQTKTILSGLENSISEIESQLENTEVDNDNDN